MSTNFPTSLDSYTNPTGSEFLNSPAHATQHTSKNDAIEALEAKLGVDSSSVATSIDYFLNHASGTFKLHDHTNEANIPEANVTMNTSTGHDHDGTDSKLISTNKVVGITNPIQVLNLTNQSDVSWTDLDLTANTSASTVGVFLQLIIKDSGGANALLRVRENGSTSTTGSGTSRTQVANVYMHNTVFCACDSGQVIEYDIDATGGSTADAIIRLSGYIETY